MKGDLKYHNGIIYYEADNNQYFPLKIGGGGGLSRSAVIALINQYSGGGSELIPFRVELSSAQIKTGNSIPIPIAPTAGIGKYLRVMSFDYDFTANTTPFTAGQILIRTITLAGAQARTGGTTLSSGANIFVTGGLVGGSNNLLENQGLEAYASADSAVGDGTIILYGTYIIVTK